MSSEKKRKEDFVLTVDPKTDESIMDYVSQFPDPKEILAMKVNGKLTNLNDRFHSQSVGTVKLKPVYSDSFEGESILRRSLVFLMSMAIRILHPKHKVPWYRQHSLDVGYFCNFRDGKLPPNCCCMKDFLKNLKSKMDDLIKRGLPITGAKLFHKDALQRFREDNMDMTVRILETLNFYEITVDTCLDYTQWHHQVLLPNTSMFREFALKPMANGWVIEFLFFKYKKFFQPSIMGTEVILKIHSDRTGFLRDVGCECVGDLNNLVREKKIENFITLNNDFQDRVFGKLVKEIKLRYKSKANKLRMILISGPSASGKTTFASKLKRKLLCNGIKTNTLNLDNYYKNREDMPRDKETDDYDFETIDALRVGKLNEDIQKILECKQDVLLPEYNFHTGEYEDNVKKFTKIDHDSVLIAEGIHCLNPKLTYTVPEAQKYKVFIAPFTPINLDNKYYISNVFIRCLRRIIRDKIHRGYSVEQTLSRWNSVRKGEHLHIFPFVKNADFIFNSCLDYEVGVLKPYLKPLLNTVKTDSENYWFANHLLSFLKNFFVIPNKFVPRDSLLQEFIGGHWFN